VKKGGVRNEGIKGEREGGKGRWAPNWNFWLRHCSDDGVLVGCRVQSLLKVQ